MAVVYLVEHQTLLKRFAAKVLSGELAANLEARARFTQEAHAASQLDHENIVTISDFGVTADQRPFFVMELLRGQTLDQRLAKGPVSIEEIVSIAVPLGRALAHAHSEGIVHRDVKPENIFLVQRSQQRWNVKVVDFGIAKAPINSKLTKMGQTLGSPMFMAPEACRGEDVDHRADIYAFGIVLYLMMCGRVPFHDDSLLKILQLQVTAPLPKPCEVNPELAPELGAILERALAKDPDARYQHIEDLLSDLEAALPPGADRLLIEAQYGSTKAFRATPFPGQSQPIPVLGSRSSQDLVSVTGPTINAQAVTQETTPAVTQAPASKRNLAIGLGLAIVAVAIVIVIVLKGSGTTTTGGEVAAKPTTGSAESGGNGNAAGATGNTDKTGAGQAGNTGANGGAGGNVATDATNSGNAGATGSNDTNSGTNGTNPAGTNGTGGSNSNTVASKVHLHVVTRPAGATVSLDGKTLGKTPLDVELDRTDGTRTIAIAAAGFAKVEQTFDASDDASFELALKRAGGGGTTTTTTTRPRTGSGNTTTTTTTKPPAGSGSDKPNLDIRLSR